MSSRLALGTAQFGLPYGIANRAGQVSCTEGARILEQAWNAKVDTLDTAIAYGESETRLGRIGINEWKVISKLPALPEPCVNVSAWVNESVIGSLARLGISRLRGLLLHCPRQLLGPQGIALYRALVDLKDQGKVEQIGVSVYGPDELEVLWPHFRIDLVQAPFNVIDRRLVTTGWLSRMHHAGTEVHVRSIFLQGLLLMDAAERPPAFRSWQPLWGQWHGWLEEQHLTPLQACMRFALSQAEIDHIVVGVDSLKQLQEVLAGVGALDAAPPSTLITEDPDLINPSRWKVS